VGELLKAIMNGDVMTLSEGTATTPSRIIYSSVSSWEESEGRWEGQVGIYILTKIFIIQ